MDGRISVSFRREPSFFDAAVVDGQFRQIIVGRDHLAGDAIIGFGSRSIREAYVNGRVEPVGYLSGLRLAPEYRHYGAVVARGFRFFKELHGDGRAKLYLTTIAEGNERAMAVLARGRAGMPAYHPAGVFHTAAIPLSRGRARPADFSNEGLEIRAARADDAPEIARFLNQHGPRRQFFPAYRQQDFFDEPGTFRDLRPEDVLLAFRRGELVGTLGLWDQHEFKQTVVNAYSPALRTLRPLINLASRVAGRPSLPKPGGAFHYLTAAIPVVADDDERVFSALLNHALALRAGGEAEYLLLGLHERDPLLPVARRLRGATWYRTLFFLVCWQDGEDHRNRIDSRPPYLELGSL